MSGVDPVATVRSRNIWPCLPAILSEPARARENADILVNYAGELVAALAPAGSPERGQLTLALNTALDRLSADTTLSKADRDSVRCRPKYHSGAARKTQDQSGRVASRVGRTGKSCGGEGLASGYGPV